MTLRRLAVTLGFPALLCWPAIAAPASAQPPSDAKAKAAREAIAGYHALCRLDGGRLWGRSLCGPLLLVDPATRAIYADRNTARHDLWAQGGLFTGTLPADVGVANTATDWACIRWTMVMLPLPADVRRRDTLLMHEAFHRIQPERLPPPAAALPDHLDTLEGAAAPAPGMAGVGASLANGW